MVFFSPKKYGLLPVSITGLWVFGPKLLQTNSVDLKMYGISQVMCYDRSTVLFYLLHSLLPPTSYLTTLDMYNFIRFKIEFDTSFDRNFPLLWPINPVSVP